MTTRVGTLMMVAFLALAGGMALRQAEAADPPLAVDVDNVSFRIVDATFVLKLDGVDTTFDETEAEEYHGLVITVEIKKRAGEELTLCAQDLPLHYHYGRKSDVAKCQGLSTYSSVRDVDRAMNLYEGGLGRSSTGLSTTKKATVYVDMFYQFMEPDTTDMHLLVAQPVGATYQCSGDDWDKVVTIGTTSPLAPVPLPQAAEFASQHGQAIGRVGLGQAVED